MKNKKIRYYLEPKSKNVDERTKPELIMVSISYGYAVINSQGKKRHLPVRYSLQENILPIKFGKKETNFTFDEDVFNKFSKNNSTVKTKMTQFDNALTEIANDYISKRIVPTPKELTIKLNNKLRSEVLVEPEVSILDYLKSKIEKDTENSGKPMKSSKRENTIKTFITVGHLIENYEIATNQRLLFESFNKVKYWEFWDVLDDILKDKIKVDNQNQKRKQRKQSYGYLAVSIRKYQKALLSTLKEAHKEKYTTPLNIFDDDLILLNKESSKSFYIETDIINKIIFADVTAYENLQNAKDYFIIASLTGMRYESMEEAQFKEIEEFDVSGQIIKYIDSYNNKTDTSVCIPLFKPVIDIINKTGFPKVSSNAEINRNLKLLFKYLELNRLETVTKHTYRSGEIYEYVPMSDLISTHDCRGTFYSNMFALNVPEEVFAKITHPDRKSANAMSSVYNKTKMLTKTRLFVEEIFKINNNFYNF